MIGNKIKEIRKLLNLSQINMAKDLNTTDRTIRDYEKGKFDISYSFLKKLIDTYNINPNYLFLDELPVFSNKKDSQEIMAVLNDIHSKLGKLLN